MYVAQYLHTDTRAYILYVCIVYCTVHLGHPVHTIHTHTYIHICSTVEPLYKGHVRTIISVLITEVSSIQRSLNTLQYYTGTQNGVLITEISSIQRSFNTLQYYTGIQNGVLSTEISAIQRFVIERFHCISKV